jgi:DNA topoisomerase VI subunit A
MTRPYREDTLEYIHLRHKERMKKNGWNYRVVKVTKDGESYFSIRDVYYGGEGYGYGANPQPAMGETVDELRHDLELMLKAFNRPIMAVDPETEELSEEVTE